MLDATTQCFWRFGCEATSVKDLAEKTGLTAASLYNAYEDKRGLFRASRGHCQPKFSPGISLVF